MTPIGVGVVGLGYWGPRLVRNFQNAAGFQLLGVFDTDPSRREAFAGVGPVDSYEALLQVPGLSTVAIATPVEAHYALAKAALEADKHVMVEKPFTNSSAQAIELVRLAREHDRVLMVDHTFLYTAAVRELRRLIAAGEVGELLYYDSIRVNLGLFQRDVDVIWDLAPHDFSILDHLVGRRPRAVSAIGRSHTPSGLCDVAYVTLDHGDSLLAHLHLNWLAPQKVRQVMIGGSRKMVLWDDIEPDQKVQVYDRGIQIEPGRRQGTITSDHGDDRYTSMISYRMGDLHAPWLDRTEALFTEVGALERAIRHGQPLVNDGVAGLRVVLLLEAASRSLEQDGAWVEVEWSLLDALRDEA